MNIIEPTYNWAKALVKRDVTNYIVLHQRAGWGDVASIHQLHLGFGYAGIGYNFYVRLDGSIYRGRPIDIRGAHAENFNWESVGVCAEGYYCLPPTGSGIDPAKINYTMPEAQKKSVIELAAYLRQQYPNAKIVRHSALNSTNCPGEYYPFNDILNGAMGGAIALDPNSVFVKVRGKSIPYCRILPAGGLDKTFAPIREVAEALGAKVTWDGPSRTVIIE